jgi:hypothetical protein
MRPWMIANKYMMRLSIVIMTCTIVLQAIFAQENAPPGNAMKIGRLPQDDHMVDYRKMAHAIGDLNKKDKSGISIFQENAKRFISISPLIFGSMTVAGLTIQIGALTAVGLPGLCVAGAAVITLCVIKKIRSHYSKAYYEMAGIMEHATGVGNKKENKNKINEKRFQGFFQKLIQKNNVTGVKNYPQIKSLLVNLSQQGLLREYPIPQTLSEMINTGLAALALKGIVKDKITILHEISKIILLDIYSEEDLAHLWGVKKQEGMEKLEDNIDHKKRLDLMRKYYHLIFFFQNKIQTSPDADALISHFLDKSFFKRKKPLDSFLDVFGLDQKKLKEMLSSNDIQIFAGNKKMKIKELDGVIHQEMDQINTKSLKELDQLMDQKEKCVQLPRMKVLLQKEETIVQIGQHVLAAQKVKSKGAK